MRNGADAAQERYAAFISYSHADSSAARWLHRSLETYRIPRGAAGGERRRIGRIFLDRSELASAADLSDRIQEAMERSDALIVICSPAAAASRWVNEEVRRFRAMGRGRRIFCLIVDGDPAEREAPSPFPPALVSSDADGAPPVEPLAADIRPGKDSRIDARLKIASGLLNLPLDALKRRDLARRQRQLTVVAATSLVLLAIMGALTTAAIFARNEAERNAVTASRTADFLRGLFSAAAPASTGGREISVREMIDRAAADTAAAPALVDEPEVRARLLVTLADVYMTLGLPDRAHQLIAAAGATDIEDSTTRMQLLATEAQILLQRGDYAALAPVLDRAFDVMAKDVDSEALHGRQLLITRAQLSQSKGDVDGAERDLVAARQAALARTPPDMDGAVTALLAAAVLDIDNGKEARGAARMYRVIAERRRLGQPMHPDVLTAFNSLGGATARTGDPVGAERWFRRVLPLQQRLFGPDSLEVALTRSNLGRALVEQRRFAEAVVELEAARSRFLAEAGPRIDTLANLDDSRGLALAGLGRTAEARESFIAGLAVAQANAMPKAVELLVDRADLECGSGRVDEGLRLVAASRAELHRLALPEVWRRARIDIVEGGCLIAAGQSDRARPLLRAATPLVIDRWGLRSLFGTAATSRLAQVGR